MQRRYRRSVIALFGHFGAGNFGNESTLHAMLCHVRSLMPDSEVTCICTSPDTVSASYNISAEPMNRVLVKPWALHNRLAILARMFFIGVPSEVYRWFRGVVTLLHTDVVIIVGTGLLTDAFGLGSWGPSSTFRWSVIAKLCRCRLCFVSVGAGPLQRRAGRFLIKSALSLADFRSYRDDATREYLNDIGFRCCEDRISPDLAFSLPTALLPGADRSDGRRSVVGLGLMTHGGMYSVGKASESSCSQQPSAECQLDKPQSENFHEQNVTPPTPTSV